MKKYFLVSILLLLGTMLGTATAQTISGKVTDPSRQPIDGATVVLQTPDSIFVEATITNADGTFLLNHQPARYRLLFQHLLYEPQEKEGTGTDAGTFTLQPKDYALQEVVVQGERPLVTVEGSRLTYDMPQDLRTTHHSLKGYAGLARGKSGSDVQRSSAIPRARCGYQPHTERI